jgi:diguanylate cyclase (GGDEF)-like protein
MLVQIYPIQGPEHPVELGKRSILVGRDLSCDLTLADDSVSRRHAIIEPQGTTHLVSDLGSTNGTFINDEALTSPHLLQEGDRVRFGNQIFKYVSADKIEAQYHEIVFKLMTTDGLTSVYNKRYLLETLDREFEQAKRSKSPLAVLMMDLDKFKSINDTHGHLAGDQVLIEFARRAKETVRATDLLARYGGEEFAVLMADTTLADAHLVAERIREVVAAEPVVFENKIIPITVSIGLAIYTGESDTDPDDLLQRADEWLYQAKQSGRNRVCFASPT